MSFRKCQSRRFIFLKIREVLKMRLDLLTFKGGLITALLVLGSLVVFAEPAPKALDQALSDTIQLGRANGCDGRFGIPDFGGDQEALDKFLVSLRDTGQLGKELTAVCGSSAVTSAAALGGSLGSLQTTKTVSQFRLTRRRVDSRLGLRGRRFGLNGSIMLAELDEPLPSTLADAPYFEPIPLTGFGVFAQGEYERRDRESTALEAGYESDVSGGVVGVDYATTDGILLGGWAGYGSMTADYTGANLLVGSPFGADTSGLSRSLSPSLIADICNLSPGGGFNDDGFKFGGFTGARFGRGFADVVLQYSHRDYDYQRNVCAIESPSGSEIKKVGEGFQTTDGLKIDDIYAGTITGETTLNEWSLSGRAGYDFGNERFLWGPRVSVTYLRSDLDGFTESGRTSVTNTVESNNPDVLTTKRAIGDPTGLELAFDDQDRTSLQTEAQLVAAYRFEPEFGAIIPRVSASWIHEFEGKRELVTVRMAQDRRATPTRFSYTTDSADENKGIIAFGITALVGARFAADLEVSHLVADEKFDSTVVTAQARWGF
jgi:uncharacterized protein YhjY with autotransporter beta-barrel domain